MKLALYSLAVVLLVALQMHLRMPRAPAEPPAKPTDDTQAVEQTVFVDTAELVDLHPSWQALRQMETTLARVGGTSGGVLLRMAAPDSETWDGSAVELREHIDRRKLEEQLCSASELALREYESDMLRALWLRTNAKREAMMANALAGLADEFREINAARDVALSVADEEYCGDRLAARLAMGALDIASKSPGTDAANMEMAQYQARQRLEDIERACSADKQRAEDIARGRVDALREAEAAKIDEELAKVEATERIRIGGIVADARERLVGDLCSFESVASSTLETADDVRPSGKVPSVAAGIKSPSASDLEGLRASLDALRASIQSDVARMVRKLAREQGVKLASCPSASVPDRTRAFEKLMIEHRWTDCAPILSQARG